PPSRRQSRMLFHADQVAFWSFPSFTDARRAITSGTPWRQSVADSKRLLFPERLLARLDASPHKAVALEIGCGVGRMLKEAAGLFQEAIGIAVAPQMAVHASEYLRDVPNARVAIVVDPVLPCASDSVDYVYSMNVFQHIPDRETIRAYLDESFRVLRPG